MPVYRSFECYEVEKGHRNSVTSVTAPSEEAAAIRFIVKKYIRNWYSPGHSKLLYWVMVRELESGVVYNEDKGWNKLGVRIDAKITTVIE